MGDIIKYPSPEHTIAEMLEALAEAAKEDCFVAFAYAFQDQNGDYTFNYLGDIDDSGMRSALMDLRRAIKNGE